MFEDWLAIQTLLMTYAERVDSGRFAEAAALFDKATYRVEYPGRPQTSKYQGADQVHEFFAGTRLYPDGTPRTKHVIANVIIELDGDGTRATSRCYVTVFQQTDELPLQPIAAGRYLDSFVRDGRQWRFSDRLVTGFLLGDLSHHVLWHESVPGPGVS
jgi:3-phenylpropionate/cinnamic acid dioxygenase small subunit